MGELRDWIRKLSHYWIILTGIVIDRPGEDFSRQKSIGFCNRSPSRADLNGTAWKKRWRRERTWHFRTGAEILLLLPADSLVCFPILVLGRCTCPPQPARVENVSKHGNQEKEIALNLQWCVSSGVGKLSPSVFWILYHRNKAPALAAPLLCAQRCFSLETGTRGSIFEVFKTLK